MLYNLVHRYNLYIFFSSRRRHTRWPRDWSSDVCSSDLIQGPATAPEDTSAVYAEASPTAQWEVQTNDRVFDETWPPRTTFPAQSWPDEEAPTVYTSPGTEEFIAQHAAADEAKAAEEEQGEATSEEEIR